MVAKSQTRLPNLTHLGRDRDRTVIGTGHREGLLGNLTNFYFFKQYLFIYLVALGLSCSMREL